MSVFHRCLAVSVLLAAPVPAPAETLVWGQAQLTSGFGGIADRDGNGESLSDETVRSNDILGRLGAEVGAFGLQLDLGYSGQKVPLTDSAFEFGRFASVRAKYDLSDALTIGAVLGKGQSQGLNEPRTNLSFKAVEGVYGSDASSLGLQLGAFDADDEDAFHDGRFVRITALHRLRNGFIEGEVGLFKGRQERESEFAMEATTWRIAYSEQIGTGPLAVTFGLDGGIYSNRVADNADTGSYHEMRVTVGVIAWFGDSDFAAAKRRGLFAQPEFGRIVNAGSNLD